MSSVLVEKVNKRFGDVVAVSEISFSIGTGVTGLLGPNGAGKTTLLKMMVGLLVPSAGKIKVLGKSLRENPKLYERIGYCPESDPYYGYMTGIEFLKMTASLQNQPNPASSAIEALERVDLVSQKGKKVRAYSRGMRQRLKVAQALLHNPEVLFLDEPLKGADPTQRKILIDLVIQLGEEGKTVVVSSHILFEVERMASQIVLINRGRLLAVGDFHAIRQSMEGQPHKVLVQSDQPHRLAATMFEKRLVSGIRVDGDALVADVEKPEVFYEEIPKTAVEEKIKVTKIASLDEDLESVFRYLVG